MTTFKPGDRVEVRTSSGYVTTGTVLEVFGDALSVQIDTPTPAHDVYQVAARDARPLADLPDA